MDRRNFLKSCGAIGASYTYSKPCFSDQRQGSFPHPMHLHGHHMKLLSIDGQPLPSPRWVDSPLIMPRQRVELAFVADNPGQWLFHCHALEHHSAGLGELVNVS